MQTEQQATPPKSGASGTVRKRTGAVRGLFFGAAAIFVAAGTFGISQLIPLESAVAQTSQSNKIKPLPAKKVVSAAIPSFADVIERVSGAVVSVKVTIGQANSSGSNQFGNNRQFGNRRQFDNRRQFRGPGAPQFGGRDSMERFFRRFGQGQQPFGQRRRIRRSQGSGFVISEDGFVVTNYHVVRNAMKVQLLFEGGKTVDARVVGSDEKTDIALLKISTPGKYKYLTFADKKPRVGDWVIAVGNPFGLGGTVTAGIVSAHGRNIGSSVYNDFLQIDAPVNRGNSGGPTFDIHGKVVGVNTAIYSPSGGSVGIGFAIPAGTVKSVVASLRTNGSVSRGYIGVRIQRLTKELADSLQIAAREGALIADVNPNLPAERAGLRSGDVIVAVNGAAIKNPRALARKIGSITPGTKIKITYIRNGKREQTDLTLTALPGNKRAARGGPQAPRSAPKVRFGMTLAPAGDVAGGGTRGVIVSEIDPSGLAARQGLRSGDIILEAGGKTLTSPGQFSQSVEKAKRDGRKAVLLRVKSATGIRFVALSLRDPNRG